MIFLLLFLMILILVIRFESNFRIDRMNVMTIIGCIVISLVLSMILFVMINLLISELAPREYYLTEVEKIQPMIINDKEIYLEVDEENNRYFYMTEDGIVKFIDFNDIIIRLDIKEEPRIEKVKYRYKNKFIENNFWIKPDKERYTRIYIPVGG